MGILTFGACNCFVFEKMGFSAPLTHCLKWNFWPQNRRFTSSNYNFEYSYPLNDKLFTNLYFSHPTSLPICRMCSVLRTYGRICLYRDLCWQSFKNDWYSAGKKTEMLICRLQSENILCSLYNDCDNLVTTKISKDVQKAWRIQCNAGENDFLDYVTIGTGLMLE